MRDKFLFFLFMLFAVANGYAQERTISGKVTAEDAGLPLSGVSVVVKENSKVGAMTHDDGKFSIKVPPNAKSLIFTLVGYVEREIKIPAGNTINVVLTKSQSSLDEVVVTAGGATVARRQLGTMSTTITGEQLTEAKAFNIGSALSGKVPGLQVNTVSSGVNPTVRLVLRGNRSILGNNEALIIVDNVVVPNSIIGNLNPDDVADIQVLNGAGAAALFGSGAANGAIMITTKRAVGGKTRIGLAQVTSFESVSYYPKLQTRFGAGTTPDDVPVYAPEENQQYGPAFDGSMRPVGLPAPDGTEQIFPYKNTDERYKFWDLGVASQSDFNISAGDAKSSYYMSAQYFDKSSITPKDKYNRFSLRVNGDKQLYDNLKFSFSTNYVQNRYNTTNLTSTIYNNLLQTPGNIPITRYKDWQNEDDWFATPDGYFNKYYDNPYSAIDRARGLTRNDYLTGNIQFKWFPISDLSVMFRTSISTSNQSYKNYTNKFTYTDFALFRNPNLSNREGSVSDGASYSTQLSPEIQLQYQKNLARDVKLNVIVGASSRSNQSKSVSANTVGGLIAADLYNVNNSNEKPEGSESGSVTNQIGVYFDSRISYKNYLFLNLTGRNDWRSVLAPEHRSFFYPSANISFVASQVVPFLKDLDILESLKFRLSVSQVGSVQIGAYSLVPTFSQGAGFPYNQVPGFAIGSRIVANDIAPEMTKAIETGVDLEMFKGRFVASATYYKTITNDQTMSVSISPTTGYSSYMTNIGEVMNEGLESMVKVEALRLKNGLSLTLSGNYTYSSNRIISLNEELERITLTTSTNAGVYALVGQSFPQLRGSDYHRDPQGRIIVNKTTGMPTVNTDTYVPLGGTEPNHRLGLDSYLTFKGFTFTTLWEYRGGNVMHASVGTGFDFSGASVKTTYFNRERFLIPNSSYLDPETNEYVENTSISTRSGGASFWSTSTNTSASTNYVFSGAFWKLREMSLSYNVPRTFIQKVKFIQSVRLGLQARNLFIWKPDSNIYTDPEYSQSVNSSVNAIGITTLSQTPPIRFYGLNISITL